MPCKSLTTIGLALSLCVLGAPTAAQAQSRVTTSAPEMAPATFPDGFLFGTAVAGFQVDMGCPTLDPSICTDTNSDWYQFATSPITQNSRTTFLSGEDPADVSPGHYELFPEDAEIMARELNSNAFRFSFEWSRIFPEATDGVDGFQNLRALADPEALSHYHTVLAVLRARGITPVATLNHYTLPTWIHDGVGCHQNIETCSPRGWVDKDRTVAEIAKYAGFMAREFGSEVDRWATINEPLAVLLPGYVLPTPDRTNPPAVLFRPEEALTVFEALVEGHARMYDAVKANDLFDSDGDGEASKVGVVYAMSPVEPMDPTSRKDVQAAENVFYLWNMAFLNAVALGVFDHDLDGEGELREDLVDRMDYIGINYYTRITVSGTRFSVLPRFSPLATFNPLNMQAWEDYPEGIYEMAKVVHDDLGGLPMIISETGTPLTDEYSQTSFMVRHMEQAARAAEDGLGMEGFFFWSLVDNYEWNHGMSLRFGLFGVDETDPTRARVPRESAVVYGQICAEGMISSEILEAYETPGDFGW